MTFHTALIVDDSKLARVTLKKKLESHGLVVEVVDSAQQAYSKLTSMQPDIIFMDHLMPDIDGFEATQHIRQMPGFECIPIVMCTGKEQEGYLEEALAIGANFILSKPPVDQELDTILASANVAVPEELPVPELMPVVSAETDVADFMAEYEEPAEPILAVEHDLAPLAETDVADFMAESAEEVVVQAPVAEIARQEQVVTPSGVSVEDVERICVQIIGKALANMPAPEQPYFEPPEINMEQILSTVNAAVSHQLAVSALMRQSELEAQIGEKITQTLDQDIQGILDLRLNILLAQKFAETNAKMESLEKQISDKVPALQGAVDLLAVDAPLTLTQHDGLNSRRDQLYRIEKFYEEHTQLAEKVKVLQKIAIGSAVLAIVAIVLAVVM